MGKNAKYVKNFIESIPDSKLEGGLPSSVSKIHADTDFRLDMQNITSDEPPKWNVQVQINRQTTISSLKRSAPASVSIALVPSDPVWTPKQIKDELIKNISSRL